MKSWVLKEARKLELADGEDKPNGDCAKVKILRASLDSGDAAVFLKQPKSPVVPSRIAVGLISESAGGMGKGLHVLLSPYRGGSAGRRAVCGIDTDGYLSDFAVVPLSSVHTLPDGITDESVIFIDDIARALNIIEKLDVQKTQYVLLYGCSCINCIVAKLCIYYQAIPIVVDNDAERLSLAQNAGAYYTVNTTEDGLKQKLKELSSGRMADHMVVDTDCFDVSDELLECVDYGGRVVLTGLIADREGLKCDISPVVKNNLSVYSVVSGDGELESAINLLATGIVDVDGLNERTVEFDDAPQTLLAMSSKNNYFKTIVKC